MKRGPETRLVRVGRRISSQTGMAELSCHLKYDRRLRLAAYLGAFDPQAS